MRIMNATPMSSPPSIYIYRILYLWRRDSETTHTRLSSVSFSRAALRLVRAHIGLGTNDLCAVRHIHRYRFLNCARDFERAHRAPATTRSRAFGRVKHYASSMCDRVSSRAHHTSGTRPTDTTIAGTHARSASAHDAPRFGIYIRQLSSHSTSTTIDPGAIAHPRSPPSTPSRQGRHAND